MLVVFLSSVSHWILVNQKNLSVDDILFGYDLLFEKNKLWAKQRWLGIQTQQNPSDAWTASTRAGGFGV